jgi:hypothetical protein
MNPDDPIDEKALEDRLRALPSPPLPDSLESRLLAAIPEITPARSRIHWLWPAGIAATAAALLIGVWLLLKDRTADPSGNGQRDGWVNRQQIRTDPSQHSDAVDLMWMMVRGNHADSAVEFPTSGAAEAFEWPLRDGMTIGSSKRVVVAMLH